MDAVRWLEPESAGMELAPQRAGDAVDGESRFGLISLPIVRFADLAPRLLYRSA